MSLSITLQLGLLALITLIAFGCNRNTPQAATSSELALAIQPSNGPTVGDSREPELNPADDGRTILSWVEKLGDKRYALRLSLRDDNSGPSRCFIIA